MLKCKDILTYCGDVCDLHTHTHFSDGSLSPTELIELAEARGLSAIALTDHNSIGGVPELLSAARGKRVSAIPGIEFSTDYMGVELHVLALGIEPRSYPEINRLVDEVTERKRAAIEGLITDLIEAGYKIDRENIHRGACGIVNRAHVATELVRCGYADSRKDAFARILYSGGPFYRSPQYVGTLECVNFIKDIGAVSVLAHPFLNLDDEGVVRVLGELRGRLDGIEVLYSEYDAALTRRSIELAEQFSLKPSGGSDFHGKNKPEIALGTGRGDLRIPLSFARDMGLI